MSHKDKRLQIRVTSEELEGISRRAQARGLSVAEYGRSVLLAGDIQAIPQQGSLAIEDLPLESEEPQEDPEWTPEVRDRVAELVAEVNGCAVQGVPPGVRCIECGELH